MIHFLFILLIFVAGTAHAQTSAIDLTGPKSYCEANNSVLCTCDAGATITAGVCQASADCTALGNDNCVMAPLLSAEVLDNFSTAKSEIQVLMDRDPDAPTANRIAVYTSDANGDKIDATACNITSNGTGTMTCSAGVVVTRSSVSDALQVTQNGAGNALSVLGPIEVARTGAGGTIEIFDAGSDSVTLAAPTDITTSNTITFTADGKLPRAGIEEGFVVGPAGATNNAVCRFDEGTGKLIQNASGVTISDANGFAVVSTDAASALSVTQNGSGNVADFTSGTLDAFVIANEGSLAMTATDNTNPAVDVLQNGTGAIAKFIDSSNEGITVEADGVLVVLSDDAAEAALQVGQSGAGSIINATGGVGAAFTVINSGAVSIQAADAGNPGIEVVQNLGGNIASFLDAATDGVTIEQDGVLRVDADDDAEAALQVTQNGTSNIATLLDSSDEGLTIEADGVLVANVEDNGEAAFQLTQFGSSAIASFLNNNSDGMSLSAVGSATIGASVTDAGTSVLRLRQDGTSRELLSLVRDKETTLVAGNLEVITWAIDLQTTDDSNTNTTVGVPLASDTGASFTVDVTAIQRGGVNTVLGQTLNCTGWNDGGTTDVGTTEVVAEYGDPTMATAIADSTCIADNTNDQILFRVKGIAATTIDWHLVVTARLVPGSAS